LAELEALGLKIFASKTALRAGRNRVTNFIGIG
jgi:hypothetical protein